VPTFEPDETDFGTAAPITHLVIPPARAVAPNPSELIFINFLLVCILLIFRVLLAVSV
jgi:hypothetical protein